jgi:hypothetical protein
MQKSVMYAKKIHYKYAIYSLQILIIDTVDFFHNSLLFILFKILIIIYKIVILKVFSDKSNHDKIYDNS